MTNAYNKISAVLQKVLHDTRGADQEQSLLGDCDKKSFEKLYVSSPFIEQKVSETELKQLNSAA